MICLFKLCSVLWFEFWIDSKETKFWKNTAFQKMSTLFRAGGIHAPHTTYRQFFSRRTYPRRLQVYSKFKFCNYRTLKIGPGSKWFSYAAVEDAKVEWVVDFLLRFCLKIGCIFNFHEIRWFFLAEIKI